MEHLTVERDGPVMVMTMNRGKANALNPAMVGELARAVADAGHDPGVRALVVASASQKLFSGGFDLVEVFGYGDAQMTTFFGEFLDLCGAIRALPKPVVAAVSGHAYAGGALLALACDFRVMAQGAFGFAVNEVNLGLVLPRSVMHWVVSALGPASRDVLLAGQPINSERALSIGLATSVAPPDLVRPRAVELARGLADKPPLAFAATKRAVNEATGGAGYDRAEAVREFMASWNGAESAARRAELASSMKKA